MACVQAEARQEGPEKDAELVLRAQRDPSAFGELYRRHYGTIERYIRRRMGSQQALEDLVAETFVAALEALPSYRQRGLPILAWLFRIATSRIQRALRRLQPRALGELEQAAASPDEGSAAGAEVRAVLLGLPEPFQSALALHYVEDFGVAECAEILGCRQGTVKSRLARGRRMMRAELERRGRLA